MHAFQSDFYGYEMRAIVLGYIRPELDYISRGMFPMRIVDDLCYIEHRHVTVGNICYTRLVFFDLVPPILIGVLSVT